MQAHAVTVVKHLFAKVKILASLLVIACVFAFSAVYTYTRVHTPARVYAATASTLNFQARLLQANGSLVSDGYYNVEFKLYSASTGGVAEWTETRTGVDKVRVVNGYLSVGLGDVTAFPGTINWDQDHWLTMNVGGSGSPSWDGEMTPRLKLTAVPYAFQSKQSEILKQAQGANTGTLDFLSLTANRNIKLPDQDGTLCIQGSADCLDVSTTGTTAITSSNSGLEISSDGLRLLGGCADAQLLRWNATTSKWECGTSGSSVTVRESDGTPSTSATTIEFGPATNSSDEFTVTNQGSGVTRITLGSTVITTNNYATALDATYVNVGESPTAGDITGSFTAGLNIGADAVALGTDTTGNYIASLGSLTGLATTGNTGEGSTPTLSVLYGSTASTAVQGNTQLTVTAGTGLGGGGTVTLGAGGTVSLNVAYGSTAGTAVQGDTALVCASGTGNLTGGGNSITLGAGGTCGAISTNNAVSFSTSVTTPLLTNAGALTVSTTGANDLTISSGSGLITLGATQLNTTSGLTFNLANASNDTFTITNSGAGVASLNVEGGATFGGGLSVTGNSTFTGTLGGLTGLTVASGGASITGGLSLITGDLNVVAGVIQTNSVTRIDNSGNLTNIGNITGTGAVTLSSTGGANALTLTSGSGTIILGSSTLQNSASSFTFDLTAAGTSTFNIGNSNGSNVANLDVTGAIAAGSGNAFNVNTDGDITSNITALNGTSTTTGGSGLGTSTSLALNNASNFDVGNYVQVNDTNCGGTGINPCYAKITAKNTNTLTITPALRWTAGATVNEYHIPELGGTDLTQTLVNRYGRGYFIAGVATGNGTTYYNEDGITTSLSTYNLLNENVTNLNIGGAATNITLGSASTNVNLVGNLQLGGTQVLDQSGNLNNIVSLTGSGALAVTSGGSGDLTLDSASGTLVIAANDSTLKRTAAGAYTIDLSDAAATTLKLTNSGTGVANLDLFEGGLSTAGTTRLTNGGALQNVTGDNANGVSFNANTITVGTLATARGGTGLSSFTTNGVLYASSTSGLAQANGTSGQLLLANGTGVPTFTTLSGDATIDSTGVLTIGADKVALGTDTTGNYVATLGTLTGLSATGNTGEGSTPALSVLYGSGANNAAAGSNTFTCTSGSGNLTGGGTVVTIGTSGTTCAAITTNNAVSFSTSVTSPTFTGTGAVTLSSGAAAGITIDSASNVLSIASSDTTLQRIAAGAYTIDLSDAGATTLTLNNSGAGAASLNIQDGGLAIAGTTVLTNGLALQNVTADTSILTTGTLGTARGGTGLSSFTTNGVLYASSTSALAQATGTAGQVLIANGSNIPTFTTLSGDVTVNSSGVTAIGANTVVLGTDTTGNYVATITTGNGLAVSGVGVENATAALSLDVTVAGSATGSSSLSGLEIAADGLRLVGNCNTGQMLKWQGTTTGWQCANDNSGLSDSALKTNVVNHSSVLNQLKNLRVVDYNFKCTDPLYASYNFSCSNQTGVIAQELALIYPELVHLRTDGLNEVDYGGLYMYGLKAVSQLANYFDDSGNATINSVSTGSTLRLSSTGALQNITGLTVISGGASITGGLNNNSGGITNTGSIAGATTINASGLITASGGLTLTGVTSINDTALTATTNIGTGTTTGLVSIGGGANNVAISTLTWDITSAGAVSGLTTINASGLATLSGGLTLTGATSINVNAVTATTNIGTGTTTGAVTIGGGLNAFSVASTGIDISTAGAVSGVTTLSATGNINTTGVYQVAGVSGQTFTCGNNTYINSAVVAGGLITGHSACSGVGLSDQRLKTNVVSVADGMLDALKNVNTVTFDYDCSNPYWEQAHTTCDTTHQTGVIAQQLAQVFPELTYQDEFGIYHVRYDALNIYNLKAVTEIAKHISSNGDANFNNLTVPGVIQAGTIRADHIEGLDYIGRIDSLESRISSLEQYNQTNPSSGTAQNIDLNNLVAGNLTATGTASLQQLTVDLGLIAKGALEVQGPATFKEVALFQKNVEFDGQINVLGYTNVQGLTVNLDLIVRGSLEIDGAATFKEAVKFEKNANFEGDVAVKGQVTVNKDAAGIVTVKQGDISATVHFAKRKDRKPIVNLTLGDGKFVQYSYKNVTEDGFDVVLALPATEDLNFSWTATQIEDVGVVAP